MQIDILTLFPEFFTSPLNSSILKRAALNEKISVNLINIRDFAFNKHKKADDAPFGGGCGMVMKPEPIYEAIKSIPKEDNTKVIFLCPTGKTYNQNIANELARESHIILLCGHYEGIDERIRKNLITDEISVGDFVLTGGEIPALIVVDSVSRLLDGVLGNEESHQQDSFSDGLLDCPHYTRPAEFNGWKVPEILLSGDHAKIDEWRLKEKFKLTLLRRPELIEKYNFDKKSRKIFNKVLDEIK